MSKAGAVEMHDVVVRSGSERAIPDQGQMAREPSEINIASFRTLSATYGLSLGHNVKMIVGEKDPAAAMRNMQVHLLPPQEVLSMFSSDRSKGLSKEAVAVLSQSGKSNRLSPAKSNWVRKWAQYIFGGFNALMWSAMVMSFLSYKPLGEPDPQVFNLGVGVLILAVILVSTIFYAVVDYNASQVMKAIKTLVTDMAVVTRDGVKVEIPSDQVYCGDIVHLSLGQRVPADIYLLEASVDLRIDRSLLTGESDPIPGTTKATDRNPFETKNVALSSTFIVQGSGVGIAFATGDDTVLGRVFQMSSKPRDEPTVLQRDIITATISISIGAVLLFVLSMLYWTFWTRRAHPNYASLNVAIINSMGCLTALVPQGLPVCVALALTIVARIMAGRHVLVKNLSIIEAAGSMSVLCSDKTGTLTEGKMFVDQVAVAGRSFPGNGPLPKESSQSLQNLIQIGYVCNEASVDERDGKTGEPEIRGNSTDVAVMKLALTNLVPEQANGGFNRIFTVPFNSKTKMMVTICKDLSSGRVLMYVKGAPDILIKNCTKALDDNGAEINIATSLSYIENTQIEWSRSGKRVILAAMTIVNRPLTEQQLADNELMTKFIEDHLHGLCFIGLFGICDPARADVPEAVATIRKAGVRVFMVTGDFRLTAESIARQVGIITAKVVDDFATLRNVAIAYKRASQLMRSEMKPSLDEPVKAIVITGDEVRELESRDWDVICTEYTEIAFARTTPEQKMLIVQEIKLRGESVVAVTGDGVNDAPALRTADIGVAMGSGSDVAKESAHIILLNNDFASIPVAIENGRLVFENLRKVTLYILPTGTFVEMMAVITNVFLGMQIPLTSYQQVIFSILHDVTMSISLMYEQPESDLMLKRPRNIHKTRLVDYRFFLQAYLFLGLSIGICCFGMFFLYWRTQGFGFFDVMFVFDKWGEGYKGLPLSALNSKVAVSQSIFYVTMVVMQIGNVLSTRSRRMSILQSNPFFGPHRNIVLMGCIVAHFVIAICNVYISTAPGSGNIFVFGFVEAQWWFLPIPLAFGVLLLDEIRKYIVRQYPESFIAKIAW